MVPRALAAAERLKAEHGIDCEVIDVRSLVPLDTQTILGSVAKTGRLFTVEENPRLCGWGAEIASIGPRRRSTIWTGPCRITTPHIPLPAADNLEDGASHGRPHRRDGASHGWELSRAMDVMMPQLGETVAEGKIITWFKIRWRRDQAGENLFEVETDKYGDGGAGDYRRCRCRNPCFRRRNSADWNSRCSDWSRRRCGRALGAKDTRQPSKDGGAGAGIKDRHNHHFHSSGARHGPRRHAV